MRARILFAVLLASLAAPAAAGERTVTLAVQNMSCASCPYIVRKTLAKVPGVSAVAVSFEAKTATVSFDDERARPEDLIAAAGRAGYPASLQDH